MRNVNYTPPYWDEGNKNLYKWYKKKKLKRLLRKRWIKKNKLPLYCCL